MVNKQILPYVPISDLCDLGVGLNAVGDTLFHGHFPNSNVSQITLQYHNYCKMFIFQVLLDIELGVFLPVLTDTNYNGFCLKRSHVITLDKFGWRLSTGI